MGRQRQARPVEKADSRRKRPREKTEELLRNACIFYHSQHTLLPDDRLCIRQTAVKFDVSYFTLRNRINGQHRRNSLRSFKLTSTDILSSRTIHASPACLVVVDNKEARTKKTSRRRPLQMAASVSSARQPTLMAMTPHGPSTSSHPFIPPHSFPAHYYPGPQGGYSYNSVHSYNPHQYR